MLPAATSYVALYLFSVLQASTSPSLVQSAFYNIRLARYGASLQSPTSHTLPQKVLESARWRLSPDIQKLPLTREILLKFFQSHDGSLVDTRFMTVALLSFTAFLIFDVLSSLKLKDLVSHQYQYQYREGAVVPIVKTGTDLCPLVNLLSICHRKSSLYPHLLTAATAFFLVVFKLYKSGSQSIRSASKLSYTRCREVLLNLEVSGRRIRS